ncbi:hypothetical protein C8N35_111112 [Breoghania corrubedonensis]|uniref:Uncharacterized protein n=2 Tax=Breoghania corrubedonensis TaxID=665038 RepID=A0A2T5UYQ8_9HYPH|nr:hypothetical protein C8N35_111112 [Breoghania corrubedonensis]
MENSAQTSHKALGELALVASHITRPLSHFHEDHLGLNPLNADTLKKIASVRSFQAPLNLALARHLGLTDLAIEPGLARDLAERPDAKLVIGFLKLDPGALLDISKYCAAAQLYPQIRRCVLKSNRQKAQAILGSEAFVIALREVPVFFPHLPSRSANVRLDSELEKAPQSDAMPHALVMEGMKTLMAFARATNRTLATLLGFRFPEAVRRQFHTGETISEVQIAELKTLLAHRGIA